MALPDYRGRSVASLHDITALSDAQFTMQASHGSRKRKRLDDSTEGANTLPASSSTQRLPCAELSHVKSSPEVDTAGAAAKRSTIIDLTQVDDDDDGQSIVL